MDKKNTMLLTVIAVATLLVAVVGATFAFFAIGVDQNLNNAKTTITGETADVPSSAIALQGNTALKLKLSAANMAQANQGHYFYASTTDTPGEEESQSKPEGHKVTVGTVTLEGGTSGNKYQCTANYTITIVKDDVSDQAVTSQDLEFVENDEAKLFLYGGDANVTVTALDAGTGIKLSDIITDGSKTGNVVFNLTANGSTATATLEAALQIKNSEENQADKNRLTNKSFVVKFVANSFTCAAVNG